MTLGTHLHFWRSRTGPYFLRLAQWKRCPEFHRGGIAYSDDAAATCLGVRAAAHRIAPR